MIPTRWFLACVAASLPAASSAQGQARDLSWPSVTVEATLDSAGRLHVLERQVMRFTGDWNGGERSFNVRQGQSFWLMRMSRVEPATGRLVPMRQGDLTIVDGWDFTSGSAIRWRARLPEGPPFRGDDREYVLEYLFSEILQPRGDDPRSLLLDHDFAFRDRIGFIERFRLTLAVDPAWEVPAGFTGTYARDSLAPGAGFVVTLPLTFRGASLPSGVDYGAPRTLRLGLVALLLLPVVPLLSRLVRRERALGRFAPVPDAASIDERWLRQHVLAFPPEVVGHAWDGRTGEAEVAATIARLVQEGKLRSSVRRKGRGIFATDVLTLELTMRRGELDGHARALVDGLFISGDVTDTEKVRRHYKRTGFDPAALIRKPVATLVDSTPGTGTTLAKPSRWPSLTLLLVAVVTFVTGILRRPQDAPLAFAGLGILFAAYFFAVIAAAAWQRSVRSLTLGALWWSLPMLATLGLLVRALLDPPRPTGALVSIALSLCWLAFFNSVVNQAMSRESAERIAFRKRLAAARALFRRELGRESPALRDEWFAYLVAFGLGRQVDKWFRAFGAEVTSAARSTSSGGALAGSSSGGRGWTGFGGGGGFAGGGSSASFAAAIGGMASSVPSPSSSSSGGGGGGGGGSSGGGGGGGW
jgi:hypothetical protein